MNLRAGKRSNARKWSQMSAVSWLISVRCCWLLLFISTPSTMHIFLFFSNESFVFRIGFHICCVCMSGFWKNATINNNHNRASDHCSLHFIAKSHFSISCMYECVCVCAIHRLMCMCVCVCICFAFICFIRLFNSFAFPFYLSLFLLLCIFNLCCEMCGPFNFGTF